jgi:hypothetical protein
MILQRLDSPKDRTDGIFILPDWSEYKSLERPFLNNQPFVSCVLAGFYTFVRDTHGRFQWFRLLNVHERTHIEMHMGIEPWHSDGCILLPRDCLMAMKTFFYSDESLIYTLEIRDPCQ